MAVRFRVISAAAVLAVVGGSCVPETPTNVLPVASVSATPQVGPAPLSVQFSSAGSGDADGNIVSYAWAFGDGGTSTDPDPIHVFTGVSTYTATLVVTDNVGGTGTATIVVEATSPGVLTPTSGPPGTTISVTVPCAPLSGHPPVATAIAALVTSPGGTVVATGSFDNSATGNPDAVVALVVPLDATPGDYEVTSSCDLYMDSISYAAAPFTVT